VRYPAATEPITVTAAQVPAQEKTMDGVDVFVHCSDRDPAALARRLRTAGCGGLS
jgi:hypothetical protein